MPHCSRPVARSAALAFGASLAGMLPLAAPAAADVSISPTAAVQGDAASVTFHVRNTRPGAHTVKVQVDLPADTPVAEVYPMTVPDWAPQIVYRKAPTPLPGLHGPSITDTASAIIWTRSQDAPKPPAEETLRLEMGPLPQTPELVLAVVQTYSDGVVQRWQGRSAGSTAGGGTVLTLTPPDPRSAAPGHHAGQPAAGTGAEGAGGQPTGQPATTVGAVVPTTAASPAGPEAGMTLLDLGVGGGLAVGVVMIVVLAARGSGRDGRRGEQHSPSAVPAAVTDEVPAGGPDPAQDGGSPAGDDGGTAEAAGPAGGPVANGKGADGEGAVAGSRR